MHAQLHTIQYQKNQEIQIVNGVLKQHVAKYQLVRIINNMRPNKTLYADGLEEALLGVGTQFNRRIAVYSKAKVMDILQKFMTLEEAEEHFDYNIAGAYVGEHTPVFLD